MARSATAPAARCKNLRRGSFMASPSCPAEAEYHGRAPSEKETEKERVSDDNRDRPGRSGLPPNLDFEREGHRDDRARYQPGVGHAGLWHSQRGLLASNRATADSGSGVHRGGTIRLVR